MGHKGSKNKTPEAAAVQKLGDHDPLHHRADGFPPQKSSALGLFLLSPPQLQKSVRAEPENVEPINQQHNPIVDELSQRRRRKRDQANGAEEREVNAGKVPAGAREMIELDWLADPADVE